MRRILSKVSPVLKVLLGAGIFAWMAFSGKLDFPAIGRSFLHWPLMLAILGLGYCQVGICAWRWRSLLHAQEIPLTFRQAWSLTMIGQLFNVAIPGSVGGDLVKGYCITRVAADRKAHAATTVLMDRVTGLIGLLFLGAAGVLMNLGETWRIPATRSLGALTLVGFFGGLAGLYVAVFAGGSLSRWTQLPGVLQNVFSALHEYRQASSVVPVALALSVVIQTITCTSFYLALRSAGVKDLLWGQFLLIVPLGWVANAIPISPAGIGVGQAAFFGLFRIVAPGYTAPGTTAFTACQAIFILICLSGIFWYLPYKHADLAERAPPEAR